ncbi:hypothetical protein B0A89_12530 [Paracoccus contaminans]|uniref:DUF2946 domain-containing protein n=1 Tax=Paracoccus contaminans TaxID=1945662 RepID=A0A1W6CZQ2_9RHOB|nr:hypothetical protein B0A89_12530 [Paracoccus contaminans]
MRQFAIGILLLAISSLVLQGVAHASPTGHALHREQSAATASHCGQHHLPGDHGAETSAGCESDDGGQMLADCCQTCLIAAVPVGPLTFGPSVNGELFRVMHRDPWERSPEGILRPPRLIAA